ncbi:hypothetical protein BDB00DRAFT_833993 [Zychaea mexicana]|uniref:uncharacterized protein n=1 Tax=Zychaea mexicana TaxID=64656 RepID=UPI0022FE13F7|nr:uncharacterized protein BDB00DRAFT_833993 [Zychaea mexicana]KAI9491316.1 hypothetical protein BDB00DRAFT_833993 [Zychaea mexicana]
MGCCVSRAADDDENPRSTVAGGKPFKRTGLSWTADTPLTQAQLENQRTIFWDTAPSYEGRPEIWQALHAAMTSPDIRMAQSILNAANIIIPTGNPSEGCYDGKRHRIYRAKSEIDHDTGKEGERNKIKGYKYSTKDDTMHVRFTELGNRYVIPMYCLVDPVNLIVPEDEEDQQQRHDDDTTGMIASTSVPAQIKDEEDNNLSNNDNNDNQHHHATMSAEEKNPSNLSSDVPLAAAAAAAAATGTSTLIPITVRLSTAQDIKVDISKTDETVGSLRTRIYMQTPSISPQTHTIRLIYLGRILQEEDRIVCEGEPIPEPKPVVIASGGVIQALVSKKQ